MLTEKELEAAIKRITDRLDEVNRLYIKKIAAQLLKIGELNATSINRIIVMTEMGADIREINRELAEATAMNVRDLYAIYQAALSDSYTDPRFRAALQSRPLSPDQNARLTQLAQNVSTQTAQAMVNLSNTTAIMPAYKDALDRAITAVSAGGMSYTEAARDIIRDLGYNGLQVQYESGYHRRLDSAVRQNIIDGVNQINQNASLAMGEMLGFDAVELSAHANSAPDHEPVQGRVFLLKEFEKMQNGEDFTDVDGNRYVGFPRAIGEWNCMHIAMSFQRSTPYAGTVKNSSNSGNRTTPKGARSAANTIRCIRPDSSCGSLKRRCAEKRMLQTRPASMGTTWRHGENTKRPSTPLRRSITRRQRRRGFLRAARAYPWRALEW